MVREEREVKAVNGTSAFKNDMKPPQFEVNFAQASEEGVAVAGRNCGTIVRVGDVFDWVYHGTATRDAEGYYSGMLRSHERLVLLKVIAIEVYKRRSDKLSEGMTGWLCLAGTGSNDLRMFDFLTTEDLGTHGHPTHTI